jgi:hypothetical protein
MWYDWQSRNPASAKSFFGGSVEHLDTLPVVAYLQYPTGGPPYLSVSAFQFRFSDLS